jgi:hypothetical protein
VVFLGALVSALALAAPAIHVVHTAPLELAGSHFRASESVKIEDADTGRVLRRVLASRAGAFVVSLPAVDRCGGFRIRAVGSAGSLVALKLPPAMCAPAASP